MSYPTTEEEYRNLQSKYEKILMPNEELTFTLRPHWRFIAVGVVAGVALLIALFLWKDLWDMLLGDNSKIAIYIGLIVIAFFFLKWTARPIVQWIFTRYYFTTNRVMVRSGVFVRKTADIPLDKVSNIYTDAGPIDRMLGCGTLIIESSGGKGFTINDVPQVEQVKKDIGILSEGGVPGYIVRTPDTEKEKGPSEDGINSEDSFATEERGFGLVDDFHGEDNVYEDEVYNSGSPSRRTNKPKPQRYTYNQPVSDGRGGQRPRRRRPPNERIPGERPASERPNRSRARPSERTPVNGLPNSTHPINKKPKEGDAMNGLSGRDAIYRGSQQQTQGGSGREKVQGFDSSTPPDWSSDWDEY